MEEPLDRVEKRKRRFLGFFMILIVLGLGIGIGTLVSDRADATAPPGDSRLEMQTDGKPIVGEGVLSLSRAFEEVANRMEPAVVNINTQEIVTGRSMRPAPGMRNPLDDFFGPFFGEQIPEQLLRRSLGSGVIVDPKGYIITNNHVVERGTKIKVSLDDKREFTADVVGTDPISDIAVIKISGDKDFPYARIGNSRDMKVGEWVIAIGSPFDLDQTVTAGIVSATGRTFSMEAGISQYSQYNDYLQTDAAINPGNSGGPLVNMNGEVVGINSFISTSSGSSAGVGFAVPSHLFVKVYNQILEKGKVSRGYLGVGYNSLPFTPAMAKFFGVKEGSGVLVTRVVGGEGSEEAPGPAARAGIAPEDVIVEFDGKRIVGFQDFLVAVAETTPGQTVKVKVVRKGSEKVFDVTVDERDFTQEEGRNRFSLDEVEKDEKPEIGLEIYNVPDELMGALKIDGGAYVTSVSPGSLADDAGLAGADENGYGDVIIEANGTRVKNASDLIEAVRRLDSNEAVVLKFIRILSTPMGGIDSGPLYTSIVKP